MAAGLQPSFLPSGDLSYLAWGLNAVTDGGLSSYIPAGVAAGSRSADQLLADSSTLGSGPFKVTVNKAAPNSTTFADQVYTSVSASGGLIDVSALTGAARIKNIKIEV